MASLIKSRVFSISLTSAISLPLFVNAAMSSSNYQIKFDSVGVGGTDTSSSASYKVRDSLEFIDGQSSSTSYRADQGYRGGIYDPVVHFNVIAQDTSTQVAATSITSTSVVVTSSAGFSTGDYIAVIQDEGLSQVAAMGLITSVAGTTLNVDFFQYASVLPTIDSSNDYVYELSGSTIPLAGITPSTASTAILGWEVAADVPTGYSVYIYEDQDLKIPSSNAWTDVSDGVVTLGVEEYGARSSDSTLASSTFDTSDTSFTSSLQQVASRSTAILKARDFLTLKLAASTNTLNGSYSHTLTAVFVGNY